LRAVSDDYFLEIEAHFARRRGTVFVLSAKDWALMQSWGAEGIPLPIVLEAIDSVFEKNKGEKTINGLHYLRHAVKELWKERKQLQVGADGQSPEENPAPLLEALAARLEGVDSEIAARVRALTGSVPAIEEQLIELERELVARLIDAEVRAEVARLIGSTPMDEKIRARTEEAMLRRVVRERFGFPRLTLF
jgi:hypothetical protein